MKVGREPERRGRKKRRMVQCEASRERENKGVTMNERSESLWNFVGNSGSHEKYGGWKRARRWGDIVRPKRPVALRICCCQLITAASVHRCVVQRQHPCARKFRVRESARRSWASELGDKEARQKHKPSTRHVRRFHV